MKWMRASREGTRYWEADGDFLKALEEWGKERECDVAAVMTTDGSGDGFKREFLLWNLNENGKECVRRFAERADGAGLELESWGDGELDSDDRTAWSQGNLAMSRKQVAPLLRECLASNAGTGKL